MKIHTTQDLRGLSQQQPTNSVSLSNFNFTRRSSNDRDIRQDGTVNNYKSPNYMAVNAAVLLSGAMFISGLAMLLASKKKNAKVSSDDFKQTIRSIKENVVGDIKEKPVPEVRKGDKFLQSKFFDKLLKWSENEPVMQAAISAVICIFLRPATIMALPAKGKTKEDNTYASAHAVSSGLMGLVATGLIALPFKSGAKYTMNEMYKYLSEDALKRLSPNLDLNTIYIDKLKKFRKPVSEWRFKDGNKFLKNYKDVEKIPTLKKLNEISAESFRIFGADVDWAKYKGESFNKVYTKDGRAFYDAIDWRRLGIIVDQDYTGTAKLSKKMQKECTSSTKVLLQDLDRGFLEKVIKDAEPDSTWKKLDINSVYKDGKVVDFRQWKEIGTGKQWRLNLDNVGLSSPYDTTISNPRISGALRIESTGEIKKAAYLKNGKNGDLGSIVDEKMAETDKRNEMLDKFLTWAPDIVTRPLVATATIALIPIVLKRVFHLEKGKKSEIKENLNKQQLVENDSDKEKLTVENTQKAPSFKGKINTNDDGSALSFQAKGTSGGKGLGERIKDFLQRIISKPLAKVYGRPMYESKRANNLADRLSKTSGEMTNHMATLGALLTSSVYMYQTLHKKDLDDDRRRTLAVNQGLCFLIPTICAYTVDKVLKNWTKQKIEYRYSNLKEYFIANASKDPNFSPEKVEVLKKDLGQKLKGVRTLISLAIFAMIYRYIAPVLITPFANKIGEHMNDKRKARAQAETQTVVMNALNQVKMEVEKSAHSAA